MKFIYSDGEAVVADWEDFMMEERYVRDIPRQGDLLDVELEMAEIYPDLFSDLLDVRGCAENLMTDLFALIP